MSSLPTKLLEQVIDTNATGIMIIDQNNIIVFWNQWLEKSSDIKKEDAINKNIFELFPDLKNSRIDKAIGLSISKGNASFISHAFNKDPFPLYSDGNKNKPIHQLTYIKSLQIENNNRYCFVQIKDSSTAVFREQQLRKMANEANKLSSLKSGFVSSVSHELRTPLTSIMGALAILRAGIEDPDSNHFQTMVNIAYNNSDRLLLLISDILDIEKIESGKMEFDYSDFDVNELIETCVSQNDGLAKKYQVNFEFKKENALPIISADKNRIFQVLNNLISNAAKFEPNNGTVNITAVIENKNIIIKVIDHGVGIPDNFRKKIFEVFTQADVSNTKGVSGTGLGLAISKTIVEHHRGEIGFSSNSGEGTCFYFTLPLQ